MARTWTASQETAITLRGGSLLVSAAAGSGKTSVLTERIIRSLLDPVAPADLSKMLVVTFTRAAAAELKARISEALSNALARDPSNKRLSEQLFLLGGAQISTIDSFFQKVVRSNFDLLDLPASFRIAQESDIATLSNEVLNGLIDEFYGRKKQTNEADPFACIRENRFARAMDHLISNRSDGKLNVVLLEFLKSLSSDPRGIEVLKHNAEDLKRDAEADFFASAYGRIFADELRDCTEGYVKDMEELLAYLAADPDANAVYGPLVTNDLCYCNAILENLESYEKTRAVVLSFQFKSFPRKKSMPVPVPVITFHERRKAWRKSETHRNKELFVFSREEITRQMFATAELCDVLYEFYSQYLARMMQEKRTRGVLEFDDVRGMLYRLLTAEDGSPTELAKSLSEQYEAVYIDEYQDVDQVQDDIFAMLGGDRRFMVGDIKQSIYGFRGSEPSIFANYRRIMPLYQKDEPLSPVGNSIFMSENFRCNRPVIEFTNLVCSFLFSACESSVQYRKEDDLVCSKKPPQSPAESFPAPVCVGIFEKKPKKADEDDEDEEVGMEAAWVAAKISELIRNEKLDDNSPITPSDIAILVRNKAHGLAFQKELEDLNVPVNGTSSSTLTEDPLLTDMLNLLRSLDNPYRDLPLSEHLLSRIGGFSLEELSTVRHFSPDTKALFDAMCAYAEQESNEALVLKVREALSWLERLRNEGRSQPADRFLRTIYREKAIAPLAQEPALLFLYDLARSYQRTSWCGLYGFLQHLENLLESPNLSAGGFSQEESAVTIMTLHHSKGLEFPIVFLCAAGNAFSKKDLQKSLLYHKNTGLSSKLYSADAGTVLNTALHTIVKDQISLEENEESIRTLYVALTRARERLFVSGTLSKKYEDCIQDAKAVRHGNRREILGCGSYLKWILAALQQPEAACLSDPPSVQFFPYGSVEKGIPLTETVTKAQAEAIRATDPVTDRYAEILQKSKEFQYPLEYLHGLPTKAAASKLRADLFDLLLDETDEEAAVTAQISLMESAPKSFSLLLESDRAPKATDVGSATHAFLEFCDFSRLKEYGFDAECSRLLEKGFVLQKEIELINRRRIEAFQKSNLMEWILQAKTVHREKHFGLQISMAELTQDPERKKQLGNHAIFVQGSIDLLLEMPDGRLLLIDYKTDRLTEEEVKSEALLISDMQKKHGVQLAYYAKAVKDMFGKAPDAVCVYSLPLGKAIELDGTAQ